MAREYTNKVLELVEEGAIDKDLCIRDLLSFLGEHEVKQFVEDYGYFYEEEEEEYLGEEER